MSTPTTAQRIEAALEQARLAAATPSPGALNRLILELGTAQMLALTAVADALGVGLLALDRIEKLLVERSGS